MMQAEYKREDHKSYFVVKDQRLDEKREEITYDLGMMCENRINGLLPVSVHSFNGRTELYYDISGKQSLRVLYEKKELQKEELKLLFRNLEQAVSELEEYFLEMERLIIDPDYIYINTAKQAVYLLYYPFYEENFEESVSRFSDYILDKICNEDEQTVIYAYNFYRLIKEEQGDLAAALQKLNEEDKTVSDIPEKTEDRMEEEAFYLDDEDLSDLSKDSVTEDIADKTDTGKVRIAIFGFLGLLGIGIMAYSSWRYGLDFSDLFTRIESVVGMAVVLIALLGWCAFTVAEIIFKRHNEKTEAAENLQDDFGFENLNRGKEIEYDPELFENTFVEEEVKQDEAMFETVLLQENCYTEQRILKGKIKGKTKQIDLSVFPFMIGKSREQVDYVIEDSSISRIHARFTLRDDIVFLTDLNSTNGTMKNGVRLQPNELVALESGDEIRFGKVVFTYY